MSLEKISNLILRLGVAFAFLYPPIDALIDPNSWIGYLPQFVRGLAPNLVLLHGFGVLEAIIALWILSGKKIFIPSVLATLILLLIVYLNLQDFQIIFRDVSIAAASLALAVSSFSGFSHRSAPSDNS